MYRMMQEGRLFEKRAQDLFLEGLVKGTSHLALGQEAVAAGFAAALRAEDLVFCTYRGHVHTLLRGAPMGGLMAELLGRATGVCGGKGGSMHLTDVAHGAMGSYAIVGRAHADRGRRRVGGAGARHRAGRRLLLRRRDHEHRGVPRGAEPRRRVAAAGRVRLREQPLYGVHADLGRSPRCEHPAADRASAYGLESILVDGNDPDAVHATAARGGRAGPGRRGARRWSRP